MTTKLLSILFVLPLLLLAGCGSDDGPTGSTTGIDGLSLMGLVDGRSFEYFQIDTLTTFDPLNTTVEETRRIFAVSLQSDNWIISDDDTPMLNLIVSTPYVLQNGYWYPNQISDVQAYFPSPSILMSRSLTSNNSWSSYTPPYTNDSTSMSFPFFFTYFGYYFDKTYTGKEEVLVPAGAYDTYRFDVDLFTNANDTIPVATAVEYYAPSVGLIKMKFEARPGFIRTLNLIDVD